MGIGTGHGYVVIATLRALNVAAFAAAVGFTALLARQITGRAWAGALAAGLCAASPYLTRASALAMTDGFALAAVMSVCWAATWAMGRGFDRTATLVAAAAAVACGMTRLTALVTAAAVLGAALGIASWRRRAVLWRPALVLAGPVVVLTGWFYALNIARYGDPAASAELLDRFERSPTGSVLGVAGDASVFGKTLATLAAGRVDRSFSDPAASPWSEPGIAATVALAIVALAVAVVLASAWTRRSTGSTSDHQSTGTRWVPLAVAVVANWLMMAQHVSGGGQPHSRYLAVAVPAGAIAVAAAVVRLGPVASLIGSGLVLAAVLHNLFGLPEVVELSGRTWGPGRPRLGSDVLAATAAGVIAAGMAAMTAAHLWRLWQLRAPQVAEDQL